jgi:hypothetical protein
LPVPPTIRDDQLGQVAGGVAGEEFDVVRAHIVVVVLAEQQTELSDANLVIVDQTWIGIIDWQCTNWLLLLKNCLCGGFGAVAEVGSPFAARAKVVSSEPSPL